MPSSLHKQMNIVAEQVPQMLHAPAIGAGATHVQCPCDTYEARHVSMNLLQPMLHMRTVPDAQPRTAASAIWRGC